MSSIVSFPCSYSLFLLVSQMQLRAEIVDNYGKNQSQRNQSQPASDESKEGDFFMLNYFCRDL